MGVVFTLLQCVGLVYNLYNIADRCRRQGACQTYASLHARPEQISLALGRAARSLSRLCRGAMGHSLFHNRKVMER